MQKPCHQEAVVRLTKNPDFGYKSLVDFFSPPSTKATRGICEVRKRGNLLRLNLDTRGVRDPKEGP